MSSYDQYVKDDKFLHYYNEYQERYAKQIAERDKVMLKLIAAATGGQPASLLDIGCSTGNLLLHAKRFFPNLTMTGGELAESSLTAARANPELSGVEFRTMDMLDIPGHYDVIVANAVAVYFSWEEYEAAMRSVAKALKPGGTYLAFEWLHPHPQDLMIIEESISHPEGLKIHFRPYEKTAKVLRSAGFKSVDFRPFEIAIDIPHNPAEKDVVTHTEMTDTGHRLQFRGALFQPWCHMVATV
jgi:cyclopropane fatty-acyl-phospholipid synthase-like methyltransferase